MLVSWVRSDSYVWVRIGDLTYGFIFAAALGAIDAFFGESVADALKGTAFAELAADEVVDAVLGFVDGLDAGDFGLVEGVCLFRSMSVFGQMV